MSRHVMPLSAAAHLEWGYNRPLHNVFAHLVVDGEFVDNRGLDRFIPTVRELIPAIDAMIAEHHAPALTEVDRAIITHQLVHDGADIGTPA
ncbi:hypothetical protein ABTY61_22750 [Kitasatospora sp. NPDC096128]|uniref:hypothetical protein n=1 Tax=Kitasatospora sp. NPDC096128 TaxID=3155547 RepID=UPI00332B5024